MQGHKAVRTAKFKQNDVCSYVFNSQDNSQSILNSKQPSSESPNLYVGGIGVLTPQGLASHKISSVLSIVTEKDMFKSKLESRVEDLDDITKHMTMMCHEDDRIAPYFNQAVDFIKQSFQLKLNTLIHCKSSDSRSPTLIAAFMVKEFGAPYQKVIEFLKTRRETVAINEHLRDQLREWEEQYVKK